MGLENRLQLEARLRSLEGVNLGRSAGSAKGKPKIEAYDKDRKKGTGGLITPATLYNPSADSTLGRNEPSADKDEPMKEKAEEQAEPKGNGEEKKKKKKKKADIEDSVVEPEANASDKKEKKKKKKQPARR
ncbi:hypothetical protein Leryth_012682 [Lithospermum erythrorhizon]|nr:hypothetical protein Leryth_012682 [Lithospermum erythrorhizon]